MWWKMQDVRIFFSCLLAGSRPLVSFRTQGNIDPLPMISTELLFIPVIQEAVFQIWHPDFRPRLFIYIFTLWIFLL